MTWFLSYLCLPRARDGTRSSTWHPQSRLECEVAHSHYPLIWHPCALCSPCASNAFSRRTTARRSRFTSDRCHFDRERGCSGSWSQDLRTISVGLSREGAYNYGFDMTSSSTRASSSDTIRHEVWASSSWQPPDFIRDWSMISFFFEKQNKKGTTRRIQSFSILVASVLVQGGIATNAVDRPLRYNQRRSWLPIIVFCTKNVGYFVVVRSP